MLIVKRWIWSALLVCMLANSLSADIDSSKAECQAKCRAAAELIQTGGMAEAVCEISKRRGRFVNGEIFVYMMNMDGVMLAHPMVPALIGENLSGVVLKDRQGRPQPMMLVNFAKSHDSGWLSYLWPRPGTDKPSEKMCYVLKVPGTNVFLVSGFYPE